MRTYVSPITSIGEGGITVLHLIGPQAISIIRRIFGTKSDRQKSSSAYVAGRLYLGYIHEPRSQEVIDEVIIHYIPPEQSLTGLATVEINAHGGSMAIQRIINCLKTLGAQSIPYEKITKLAYKNHKFDLIQKEALNYLIKAPTRLASLIYLTQYQGQLSEKITQVIKSLEGIALTKDGSIRPLRHSAISAVNKELHTLSASGTLGLALSYPRRIVITGRPNVGKSTLFNALFNQERVITHHLPGTTRDAVEETIALDGVPFRLIDTAGLGRKTKGIERLAQSISHTQLKQAELVIAMLDGSQALHGSDLRLLKRLPNKKTLVVINKTDLPQRIDIKEIEMSLRGAERRSNPKILTISALQGTNLDLLRTKILDMVSPSLDLNLKTFVHQPVIFTHRQYNLLRQAQVILEKITASTASRPKKSGLRKVKAILARVIHH